MKENPGIQFLWLLLVLSISCFISVVSVSASSVTNNQIVVYPVHSANNYYTAEVTSNNFIIFRGGGQELWSQKINHQIGSIAISSDGEYLAVGCDGGVIYLYSTDWSPVLQWERTFGEALIKSISLPANSNFIEASNVLDQEFLISRAGNLIRGPTTPAVASLSSASVSPQQETPTQTDSSQVKTDSPIDFGNDIFIWVLIAAVVLVVFSAIIKSHKKTQPTRPQKGTIFAKSVPEGAEIYLNDVYQGISPLNIRDLPPGLYSMKATLKGYITDRQEISITSGQSVWLYTPTLRKLPQPQPTPPVQPTPKQPPRTPSPPRPPVKPISSFQDLITQLGAKERKEREAAQKDLIIKVNTEGKPAIQKIIKELETQPSGIKREIVNLLYYLSRESQDGGKVIEELINALTYSSPDVKWLIIQTLGRIKDKRAIHALEAATSDPDFLVRYWAIISMKNVQES